VPRWREATATLLWAALLAVLLRLPARPGGDLADGQVRNSIRLALAGYALAVGLMSRLTAAEWAGTGRGRTVRVLWTLAWATYLLHVGLAFDRVHRWSHALAVEVTRERSGVGEGIYVSHLFGLLWGLDVAWWWLRPRDYAARQVRIGRALHGFMAFIIFNGTVVYESGPIRWAALAGFTVLGGLWLARRAGGAQAGTAVRSGVAASTAGRNGST
jgi:hypothetical protein